MVQSFEQPAWNQDGRQLLEVAKDEPAKDQEADEQAVCRVVGDEHLPKQMIGRA